MTIEVTLPLITILLEIMFAAVIVIGNIMYTKYKLKEHDKRIEKIEEITDDLDVIKAKTVENAEKIDTHLHEGKEVITDIAVIKTEVKNINNKLDKMNGKH